MTSPVPVTAKTPLYDLEYLAEGEPAFWYRAKLERLAKRIEVLLQLRALAPPAAQDLAAVAGRVGTLEAQEAFTSGALMFEAGFGQTDEAGMRWGSHFRQGIWGGVHGAIRGTSALAANTGIVVAQLPVGYRPVEQERFPVIATSGGVQSAASLTVWPSGPLQLIANSALAAGYRVSLKGTWLKA